MPFNVDRFRKLLQQKSTYTSSIALFCQVRVDVTWQSESTIVANTPISSVRLGVLDSSFWHGKSGEVPGLSIVRSRHDSTSGTKCPSSSIFETSICFVQNERDILSVYRNHQHANDRHFRVRGFMNVLCAGAFAQLPDAHSTETKK
jgi:hypothetical protein